MGLKIDAKQLDKLQSFPNHFERTLTLRQSSFLQNFVKRFSQVELDAGVIPKIVQFIDHLEKNMVGRLACDTVDFVILFLYRFLSTKLCSNVDESYCHAEIGTLFGGSAVLSMKAVEMAGKNIEYIMVDPLDSYYGQDVDPITHAKVTKENVIQNLNRYQLANARFQIIEDVSNSPRCQDFFKGKKILTLYIDGDHGYEGVRNDWLMYSNLVVENGYVIFDNYNDHSWLDVTEYLNRELMHDLENEWMLELAYGRTLVLKKERRKKSQVTAHYMYRQMEVQLNQIRGSLEAKTSERNYLERELETIRAEREQLKRDLQASSSQKEQLAEERERLRKDLQASSSQKEQLAEERERLKRDLQASSSERENLKKDLDLIQASSAKENGQLRDQSVRLQGDLEAKDRKVMELSSELETQKKAFAQESSKIQKLATEVKTQQEVFAQARAHLEQEKRKAEKALEECRQALKKCQQEVCLLSSTVDKNRQEPPRKQQTPSQSKSRQAKKIGRIASWWLARAVRKSGFFDADFYLNRYPDVKKSGMNPARHYIRHGWREGRDPSAKFSTNQYLALHPDVKNAGMNPLVHYIRHGIREKRSLGL